MDRLLLAAVSLLGLVALGACVPMMAASAVGMAANSMRAPAVSNAHLAPTAETACAAEAAPHGKVKIIDVQQKRVDLIIVWGTAGEGAKKLSFECHYTTTVASFRLRKIAPAF